MDENISFSGTLYGAGFRYIVTELDDMMRIAYREERESDEHRSSDIMVSWEEAEKLGRMIVKLAELNRAVES